MKHVVKTLLLMISVTAISACGSHSKKKSGGETDKKTTSTVPKNTGSSDSTVTKPTENPNVPGQTTVNPPVSACSNSYEIAGTANPYLAGAPLGTELEYKENREKTDAVRPEGDPELPNDAPVDVIPADAKCFAAGQRLYFQVSGTIAYDNQPEMFSDADGQANKTASHDLKSIHGISDISAPINSLIGVFLDDTAFPRAGVAAPQALDFGTAELRNFKTLSPKIGQLFFIGDGKDASGLLQSFVVPQGTTHLYLAIMDEYEWVNNKGKLSGTIQWVKP